MNERIKQLAVEAFFDDATGQPSDQMYTFSDHKMQRFAELIVQECMEQVFYTIEDEEQDNISGSIRDRITQHFGVRE